LAAGEVFEFFAEGEGVDFLELAEERAFGADDGGAVAAAVVGAESRACAVDGDAERFGEFTEKCDRLAAGVGGALELEREAGIEHFGSTARSPGAGLAARRRRSTALKLAGLSSQRMSSWTRWAFMQRGSRGESCDSPTDHIGGGHTVRNTESPVA